MKKVVRMENVVRMIEGLVRVNVCFILCLGIKLLGVLSVCSFGFFKKFCKMFISINMLLIFV